MGASITHPDSISLLRRENMPKFQDLTGNTYNHLQVLGRADNCRGCVMWHCICDCGNKCAIKTARLKNEHTKSCGCIATNRIRAVNKTHGMSGTPEWYAYWAASQRCSPNNKEKRANYYDRGIRFLFTAFEQFFAEVGFKPSPQHSLDRIDNDGPYGPGNVRWATPEEQIRNQRCNNCDALKVRIKDLESKLAAFGQEKEL